MEQKDTKEEEPVRLITNRSLQHGAGKEMRKTERLKSNTKIQSSIN